MVHAFLYTTLSDHHSCYRATTPHFQALPGSSSPRCHQEANRLGPGPAPPPPPSPTPTAPGMPTIFSPLKEKNLLCDQGLDPQGGGGDWDKESKHRAAVSASCYHSAKKLRGFPGGSVVKNKKTPPANVGSIPGLGRVPGEGNGTPLQYSCLGNPTDRGTWRATVHGVAKESNTS